MMYQVVEYMWVSSLLRPSKNDVLRAIFIALAAVSQLAGCVHHSASWVAPISKTSEAVVPLSDGTSVLGTGFFIEPQLIVTSAHVHKEGATLYFESSDEKLRLMHLVWLDKDLDLATFRVSDYESSHVLSVSSVDPKVGTPIVALGFPLGAHLTATAGIVSADLPSGLLQTDVVVFHGNSGGPIVDRRGDAIGVVTFKGDLGISFAVRLQHLHEFMPTLR